MLRKKGKKIVRIEEIVLKHLVSPNNSLQRPNSAVFVLYYEWQNGERSPQYIEQVFTIKIVESSLVGQKAIEMLDN